MAKLIDVEQKYRKECYDFDTLVMTMNEEVSSEVKEKAPEYESLMDNDGMTHMMADGSIVAIDVEHFVTAYDACAADRCTMKNPDREHTAM
mmetsp:Transcript_1427/g.1209  ORF Transcript_1427/g.1209 Transcript_1427/m.1209 type:complete len:91 (-) Transcript_1427:110-382(-)